MKAAGGLFGIGDLYLDSALACASSLWLDKGIRTKEKEWISAFRGQALACIGL